MTVRGEILELAALGRFPVEVESTAEQVARFEVILPRISPPVSDDEARVLGTLFPRESSTFGLAWSLVQLIETAPNWPLADVLGADPTNEWIDLLRTRIQNAQA